MKKHKGVLLVLGAKSDIGEALAYEFAQQGYAVLLAARQAKQFLIPLSTDLKIKYQVACHVVEFDGIDFESHASFYENLALKPTVVISVFGVLGAQALAQNNWPAAFQIIQANFTGHVSILNIIANDFEAQQQGTIIGISSVAGERGRQSNYFYGAAKAAFSTYLDGLRNRLFSSNTHVMTVKPGFVRTQMTAHLPLPAPLTASPQKVAHSIYKGYKKRKNTLYVFSIWKWIMLVIRLVPEFIFKRLKL